MDTAIIHTTIYTAMVRRDTTPSEPLTIPSRMMPKMTKNMKDTTHERTRLRMNYSSTTSTDLATRAIELNRCLMVAEDMADMAAPTPAVVDTVVMAAVVMVEVLAALVEEATEATLHWQTRKQKELTMTRGSARDKRKSSRTSKPSRLVRKLSRLLTSTLPLIFTVMSSLFRRESPERRSSHSWMPKMASKYE